MFGLFCQQVSRLRRNMRRKAKLARLPSAVRETSPRSFPSLLSRDPRERRQSSGHQPFCPIPFPLHHNKTASCENYGFKRCSQNENFFYTFCQLLNSSCLFIYIFAFPSTDNFTFTHRKVRTELK